MFLNHSVQCCLCPGIPYFFIDRSRDHRMDSESGLKTVTPMLSIGASSSGRQPRLTLGLLPGVYRVGRFCDKSFFFLSGLGNVTFWLLRALWISYLRLTLIVLNQTPVNHYLFFFVCTVSYRMPSSLSKRPSLLIDAHSAYQATVQ